MSHPAVKAALMVAVFYAAVILSARLWPPRRGAAALPQETAFPHAPHRGLGIPCLSCHLGARDRTRAGIPSASFCVLCHSAPAADPRLPVVLVSRLTAQTDVAWPYTARLPWHVFFSHRRHVALASLECGACHVEGRDEGGESPAGEPMSMTECIDCHRRERVTTDCAMCHR